MQARGKARRLQVRRIRRFRAEGRLAHAIMGGVRARLFHDPPLTCRDCADFMGFTPHWIRQAITDGVTVKGSVARVKLEAETLALALNGRHTYRIHVDKFTEFLQAIGWKHLPHRAPVQGHETTT